MSRFRPVNVDKYTPVLGRCQDEIGALSKEIAAGGCLLSLARPAK